MRKTLLCLGAIMLAVPAQVLAQPRSVISRERLDALVALASTNPSVTVVNRRASAGLGIEGVFSVRDANLGDRYFSVDASPPVSRILIWRVVRQPPPRLALGMFYLFNRAGLLLAAIRVQDGTTVPLDINDPITRVGADDEMRVWATTTMPGPN